jgi:hypothetical protein
MVVFSDVDRFYNNPVARVGAPLNKNDNRVEEAEANTAFIVEACNQHDELKRRADIAEQREQALVEALRFYADPKNWTGGTILDMEASHFDGWSKAQAALSAWEASNPARQASNGDRHAGEAKHNG